jgi:hypothetical protein
MKPAIWALIGFGLFLTFFGFFAGLVFQTAAWFFWLGILIIAGGLFLGLRPGGILRKEATVDTWAALIDEACVDDGRERTEQLYNNIASFLDASEAPNLKVERKFIAPTFFRSIAGQQREFLVLTDTTNSRLEPYQIYISARPYGVNLAAEWFLTYKPKFWLAALALIPFVSLIPKSLSDIDFFDQQDLRAYAANAHHCTLGAVQELMTYLHQDPAKLDKGSKGFFNVS